MARKKKASREQLTFLPESLVEYVSEDNPVRAIDVFVENLDIVEQGLKHGKPEGTGRSPYNPRPAEALSIWLFQQAPFKP